MLVCILLFYFIEEMIYAELYNRDIKKKERLE